MKAVLTLMVVGLTFSSSTLHADEVIQVTKPGDGQMTCEQINAEISEMDTVINTSSSSKSSSQLAGIGASIAGHFAGLAGGGIGAAVATNGANAVIGKNTQTAEERMKAADQRRTMLMGIHAGKGC